MSLEKRKEMALHIASIAAELFYHEGINVVGVDRIAAKAKITKRTLYRYYSSKDVLIAAALRHDLGVQFPRTGTPRERIKGAFDATSAFLIENNFRGCPYINAAAELVDRRHPARIVIVEATARRRAWFQARAAEANVRDPSLLAEQIEALFDGALAGATKRAELVPLEAAAAAVITLLDEACSDAGRHASAKIRSIAPIPSADERFSTNASSRHVAGFGRPHRTKR